MLVFIIFLISLCKALMAAGVGAALAVLLYLIGKIVRCNLPAVFRWGVAAAAVSIYAVHSLSDGPAESSNEAAAGYGIIQFWSDAISYGLAALTLLAIGIVISTVKGAVKIGRAGMEKLHGGETHAPPPLPPSE